MYIDTGKNDITKDNFTGNVEITFDIKQDNRVEGTAIYKTKVQGWDIKVKSGILGNYDPESNLISMISEVTTQKYEGKPHDIHIEINAKKKDNTFIGEKDIVIDDIIMTSEFIGIEKKE